MYVKSIVKRGLTCTARNSLAKFKEVNNEWLKREYNCWCEKKVLGMSNTEKEVCPKLVLILKDISIAEQTQH